MTKPGFFEIYPSARPSLPAGRYELETDQDLTTLPPEGPAVAVDVPGTDVHFNVLAPRYTLPPDQLLSTFPPAGAVGDWSQRLPQVVCRRRTLPWERNPRGGDTETAPPWLALVVLAEGEGAFESDAPIAECVTPGIELNGDSDTERGSYLEVTESVVQAVFPTAGDLARLAHVRKVDLDDTELALGDDDGYMAVLMANRLPQPGPPVEPGGKPTSRKYTAYLLNVEEQLEALPKDDIDNVHDNFQIMITALISPMLLAAAPAAQPDDIVMKPHVATPVLDTSLLIEAEGAVSPATASPDVEAISGTTVSRDVGAVSGQGYAAHAHRAVDAGWATGPTRATTEGTSPAHEAKQWKTGETLAGHARLAEVYEWYLAETRHRFPVLLSWDFVCTGTGTFESLMTGLDTAMLGTVGDGDNEPTVGPTGHVELDHTTRRGEPTTVWYRGPLVPLPTERRGRNRDGDLPIAHSADEIRPVVPDGREDVSLSAGFEIGRLLALSKPGIVGAMMGWREELFGAARAATVADRVGGLSGAAEALTTGGRRLEDLLTSELIMPYAERAVERLPRAVDDMRVSRRPADLVDLEPDQVLTGLGLDVAAVTIAVSDFGLAGLSEVRPRQLDDDAPRLSRDPELVSRLRSTVEQQVTRRAADALRLGESFRRIDLDDAARIEVEDADESVRRDALDDLLDGRFRDRLDETRRPQP